MKKLVKDILAYADYLLYKWKIKKCGIKVHSVDETIEVLLNTKKSMVRFGDGEISIIRGKRSSLQNSNPQIIEDLKRILKYEYDDLIVTIPDIFNDLSIYIKGSGQFWRDHLLFSRRIYEKYCMGKTYYNTSVSRFYYTLEDKSRCEKWISQIKEIWAGKDIVIVEGIRTHNGVDNDLFDRAGSIERIIGPGENAYAKWKNICEICMEYPKDRLFLVSLGAAAKPITEKLFLEGYRVIDIGNLDVEYDWYLKKAKSKEENPKHNMITQEMNERAGYIEYLNQIRARVK